MGLKASGLESSSKGSSFFLHSACTAMEAQLASLVTADRGVVSVAFRPPETGSWYSYTRACGVDTVGCIIIAATAVSNPRIKSVSMIGIGRAIGALQMKRDCAGTCRARTAQ